MSFSSASREIASNKINDGELYCPFCKRKLCSSPKKDQKEDEGPESYAFCRFCYQEFNITAVRTSSFHYHNVCLNWDSPDFGDYFKFNGEDYDMGENFPDSVLEAMQTGEPIPYDILTRAEERYKKEGREVPKEILEMIAFFTKGWEMK